MKINIDELRKEEDNGNIRSQTNSDGLIIWTYTDKCQFKKNWTFYTRSARGLVTDKEGNVITRPFPKFFNLYEMEETLPQNLPPGTPEITPKFDGSLLNISMHKEKLLITTKGSFDNLYIDWAKKHLQMKMLEQIIWYSEASRFVKNGSNYTLCCEVVLPENEDPMRRVVYHPPGIYLLAIFDNESGQEIEFDRVDLRSWFELVGITVPEPESKSIDYILEQGPKEAGTEGWVVRYPNGLRVKIKTWWYLSIFRFINHVNDEGIKEFMINNPDDDGWLMNIPEELQDEVKILVKNINMRYDIEYRRILELFREASRVSETRKDFAMIVKEDVRAPFLFMLKDGKDIRDKLLRIV